MGSKAFLSAIFVLASACSSACSSGGSTTTVPPEAAGQSCKAASECYPGLDAGTLRGAAQCLDRVTGGYCTHLCESDADCCAVPGECKTGFKQVCSPFESTGKKMCFLSCESGDVKAAPDAGALDATIYCQTYANRAFSCRSSGGGSENRKVCVP